VRCYGIIGSLRCGRVAGCGLNVERCRWEGCRLQVGRLQVAGGKVAGCRWEGCRLQVGRLQVAGGKVAGCRWEGCRLQVGRLQVAGGKVAGCRLSSSQFLVLGSWFSVPGSWFLVLGSRFSVLGSWFLILGSRFSFPLPSCTHKGKRNRRLFRQILPGAFSRDARIVACIAQHVHKTRVVIPRRVR